MEHMMEHPGPMMHEYAAGQTSEDTDSEVPDFVRECQDELATVREAISKAWTEKYPPYRGRMATVQEPDPMRMMALDQSIEALQKEENRLQAELNSYIWLIPPAFDPPHNAIVSKAKAKEILGHGEVHGQPLSERQKRFFGFIAGGGKPTRV